MTARHFAFLATLFAATTSVACASNDSAPTPDACASSSDPCACVTPPVGATCVAQGPICACASDDSGAPGDDAGPADAAPESDASSPPDMTAFVGRWSPLSGTGQANCGGTLTSLPPDTGAVLTFAQAGARSLEASSSGAGDCTLELTVSGDTATLATSGQSCTSTTSDVVTYQTFSLVFTPAPAAPNDRSFGGDDAGSAVANDASTDDAGGISVDAGPSANDAGLEDAGQAGADAASPSAGAGSDAGPVSEDAGAPPPNGTLDWELSDTDGTCTTTLHYTLVRVP